MNVYVVCEEIPYEANIILGIYLDEGDAEKRKSEAERDDSSGGYNEFEIEKHEVE